MFICSSCFAYSFDMTMIFRLKTENLDSLCFWSRYFFMFQSDAILCIKNVDFLANWNFFSSNSKRLIRLWFQAIRLNVMKAASLKLSPKMNVRPNKTLKAMFIKFCFFDVDICFHIICQFSWKLVIVSELIMSKLLAQSRIITKNTTLPLIFSCLFSYSLVRLGWINVCLPSPTGLERGTAS